MDIRRLTMFLRVVDHGTFTAAADALDCSQPAVSQAIRELETELSTPLFYRIGRRVVLTPAGSALVTPARQLLRDLDVTATQIMAINGLRGGRVDLACLPTLAAAPLAPLVGEFRQHYPDVSVTLAAPENTEELLDLVHAGRAEIGITEYVHSPGLTTIDIGRHDFFVVFPPGSKSRTRVSLHDIAEMSFIATPSGTSSRGMLDGAFKQIGLTPRVGVEAAQREALLPLILAGAGVGLLPESLATIARTLRCVVAAPEPPIQRSIAIVHRDGPLTPGARAFLKVAVNQ
jgi:LysR family carnitine catabolism transcriptional activator